MCNQDTKFMAMLKFALGFVLSFLVASAYAAPASLTGMVNSIETGALAPLSSVIISMAYLAGTGFLIAAIFKFKAHKDNPTQVTVGTPVMLLFIGLAFLLLPGLLSTMVKSIGFASTDAGSLTFANTDITASS